MSQHSSTIPPPPPMSSGSSSAPDSKATSGTSGTVSLHSKKTIYQHLYAITFLLMTPVTLPFSVTFKFFQQSKNIGLVIFSELKKVVGLGLNAVELGVLLTRSLGIITFKDGNTKALMPRMNDVYNKMAKTLIDFHALPCTKQSGALAHLMLNRLPTFIWEYVLPYPHPFFKGSVTQTIKTDSHELITSTEAVPEGYYSPFVAEKKKTKSN